MKEEKNIKTIGDIFFGKAGEILTNFRLFLRGKKIAKFAKAEKEKIASVRDKLSELYGGSTSIIETEPPKPEDLKAKPNGDSISIMEIESPREAVFIPLSEIAKKSTYSKNYINFSARQGKLKAQKIGGV